MQFWNSAIAKNTGGDCDFQNMASFGGNLDSDNTCKFTGSTDLPGKDPGFSPLSLNVYNAASKTSAVVDTGKGVSGGVSACSLTDEKNNVRPVDGNGDGTTECDIGAMESKLILNLENQVKLKPTTPMLK
jgi:hypothetical protein